MKHLNLIFCFLLLNFITAQSVTFRCMEAEIFAKGCPTCDNSRTGKMITGIELNITGTKTEFINPCVVKYDSLDNISIIDYRNVVKTFKRTQTSYSTATSLLKALGQCTTPDGAPAIDTLQYINDTLGISLYGDSVAMYKVRISPTAVIRFDTIKYENDTLYLSLENDGEAVHKLKISSGTTQSISISSGKGTISLTSGGSVTLNDSSATNEIQDLSFASKSGTTNTLNITNGSGVKIKDGTGITVSRDSVNQITITNNGYARFDTAKYANDTLTLSIENDGQAAYKLNINPSVQALKITFNSIANANALVTDASVVSNWNTFFNLPTNGTAFTSVQVVGAEIRLFGGANITLKNNMFWGNNNLIKFIDEPGIVVTLLDNTFRDCRFLTDVSLPNITSTGDQSFQTCDVMTKIDFPNLKTVGWGVFQNCSGAKKVNLPTLQTGSSHVFANCSALTEISLPKLTSTQSAFFSGSVNLTTIDIPNCTNLGGSTGANSVFTMTGKSITLTIPASLMTANSGSPDGDIAFIIANNTVTLKQNLIAPQKIDTFTIVNDTIRLSIQDDREVYKNVSLKKYLQTVDTFRISGGNLELSLSNDGAARSQLAVTQIAPVQNIKAGNNVTISGTDTVIINAAPKDTAYYFPENYGAVVNDTIDDRAAIQQAIDSACARGGGIVWLRKGDYRIKSTASRGTYESGLHLCSNVNLMGTGYGSVITNKVATAGRHIVSLQHNGANMTLQDFQIKSDSLPSGAAVYSDTTVSNVVINHVKIDRGTCWGVFLKNAELSTITNSDIQNNGGCHCVELNNASRNTVKSNWLYSNATKDYWPSRGNGVEVFYDRTETIRPYSNIIEGNNIWGTGGGVVVWGDSLTTINNNIIRTVEGHGMVVKRQDDALPYYPSIGAVITGNIIYGTGYANNSSLGILVDYDSRDVIINGNKLDTIQSEYAPAGGGVGMEIRASGTVINNNSIRHCSVNGISITSDADYCTVTGNNIIDVSILLENGYKGISCSGDRCTINSNNVHDLRGTHRMDVCIYVPGNDCVITGNNASGAATGDAIYCPGTGNVEANNKE